MLPGNLRLFFIWAAACFGTTYPTCASPPRSCVRAPLVGLDNCRANINDPTAASEDLSPVGIQKLHATKRLWFRGNKNKTWNEYRSKRHLIQRTNSDPLHEQTGWWPHSTLGPWGYQNKYVRHLHNAPLYPLACVKPGILKTILVCLLNMIMDSPF